MGYIHGGTLDDFWNDPDFNPYKAYIAGGFFAFVCVNYLTKFTVPQHMQHTLSSRQVKNLRIPNCLMSPHPPIFNYLRGWGET